MHGHLGRMMRECLECPLQCSSSDCSACLHELEGPKQVPANEGLLHVRHGTIEPCNCLEQTLSKNLVEK